MKLTPVERSVLSDLLLNGDDRPANIARRTGKHRGSVSRSCNNLQEKNLVRNKGEGVWTLTNGGVQVARNITD